MTVAVLIVNWNSRNLLGECLKSLSAQTRTPDRVIIVDNNSTDDSLLLAAELVARRRGHPAPGECGICSREQHRGGGRGRGGRARAPQPGRVSGARLAGRTRRGGRMSARRGLLREPDVARHPAGFPRRRRRQLSLLGPRLAQRSSDARARMAGGRYGGVRALRRCRALPAGRLRVRRGIRRTLLLLFRGRRPGLPSSLAGVPMRLRARRRRQARELRRRPATAATSRCITASGTPYGRFSRTCPGRSCCSTCRSTLR